LRRFAAPLALAFTLAGIRADAIATAVDPSFAPDVPEPGSIEAIAAATTEPRFGSPWVAYVPEHPSVPSPTDFLGHIAGAPGELTGTAKLYGYFRALAAASPRVQVEVIGHSEEGREILLVVVADEEAQSELGRFREATAQLADPRRCDAECFARVLPGARPIYYLNGGLHSTETGSPEMLMELAYRLAVSERPEIRAIRERLIVLINPVSEPDGRDRVVEWYTRHLKGKTDYDALPETSPPFWGKYVFHDNNRDAHQRELALTRAIEDTFLRWHPQVVHDLHESIPLLLTWTGTGPYNVQMDPILVGEWHQMAFQEVRELSALGMPGVWTWGFGEGWAHVFQDSVAINHNAIGRGYETFGITSAETMDVRLDLRDEEYAERPVTRREWYRPWPPPRRFRWSLRNNTNYMQTGVLSILRYASQHAEDLLRDFHLKGKRAVERGASEAPYAFVVPEAQDDRARVAAMIELLRAHGIEVSRAQQAFEVPGEGGEPARHFEAGTFVVRLDQPYRGYAIDLLEPQKYPADLAPFEPYDDVSWALPVHFGVESLRVDAPSIRDVALDPVTAPVHGEGRVEGDGPVFLLADTGQEALLVARHRLAGFRVEAAEEPFSTGGVAYPAGSWILPAQRGLRDALRALADELGLELRSAAEPPAVPRHAVDLPRIAVLATWSDTQAAGWLRLYLDRAGIPYTSLLDDGVKRGGLSSRFDVILYPHTGQALSGIIQGIDPRHGPLAYTRTQSFPSHGTPASSPDITGGLGYRGVAQLQDFVERGGVLVTLGGASTLPIEGGFVRNVRRAKTKELFTPGAELRARFTRVDHPLAYGYPESISVMRRDLPAYETREADLGWAVLRWGSEPPRYYDEKTPEDGPWAEGAREVIDAEKAIEQERRRREERGDGPAKPVARPDAKEREREEALVVSGGVKGGEELEGKPAILDVPVGTGRVVAFNFDPIHRLMTRSDFRLLWNLLLHWNDLPPPHPNPASGALSGAEARPPSPR
jgi:hypothetical protein